MTVTGYYKALPNAGWSGIGLDFFDGSWSEISDMYIDLGTSSEYRRFTMNATPPAGTQHISLWFCGGDARLDNIEVR